MNYTYIKAFYVIATCKNISKAAKELGVSQPALSRIIGTLEKENNIKLFVRSKAGVTLTREGQLFYELIKQPYDQLKVIEERVEDFINVSKPTVKIGATATALHGFLFDKLDNLKREFPNIEFQISSDSSVNLYQKTKENSLDFSFITTPFKPDENAEVIEIYSFKNVLIAPIKYKDELKGKISIKDLHNYPFVLLNKNMQFRTHIDKYLRENGIRITPIYETDSSGTLIPFVEHDCGLTFVPERMVEKSDKYFVVDLLEEMPTRSISFVYFKNNPHLKIVEKVKSEILKK